MLWLPSFAQMHANWCIYCHYNTPEVTGNVLSRLACDEEEIFSVIDSLYA